MSVQKEDNVGNYFDTQSMQYRNDNLINWQIRKITAKINHFGE